MKKLTLLLIIFICSIRIFASPQLPDYFIYGKDTIATYNLILEQYLQKLDTSEIDRLFGLAFRNGASFNCWRGYQAFYKVDHDSLFLVDIINCGERRNVPFNKTESIEKVKAIFKDNFLNGKVFLNWFSGYINFPLNNNVLRWDGVFYKIFENEKVITIENGKVNKIEDVQNYIDDPKRIDRKYKDKVSDLLFKQLKKAKWKNSDEFDCSTKYFVTIDGNGNVSGVKMLYSAEEIEKYYEQDEYNYCISKIYNVLKPLKFDIIKDKGLPISEDIYIELWIEDNGKIENWTR